MAQNGHREALGWFQGPVFPEERVFGAIVALVLIGALYLVQVGTAHGDRLRAEAAKMALDQR